MMAAVVHHARSVEESRHYYEKKQEEGKTHNQAVRAVPGCEDGRKPQRQIDGEPGRENIG